MAAVSIPSITGPALDNNPVPAQQFSVSGLSGVERGKLAT